MDRIALTAQVLAKGKRAEPKEETDTLKGKVKKRITRDAFLYMEPGKDNPEFAQCSTCVFRVGGKLACALMGGEKVPADATCAMYGEGGGIPKPVANYAKDEIGYTVRQVRCENCRFGGDECQLFYGLNEAFPNLFDLDVKIKPHGCCNANTEK